MHKIIVIGIGPGDYEQMTIRAVKALESCDVIAGYTVYVDLLRPHFPDKPILSTPMRKETERCRLAFEEAAKGRTVAFVCSGDAGVYGLSGLILSMKASYPGTEVEIIPGVTAALSGAALLGAPLIHDFCVISLSDLLTDPAKIECRLRKASEGDFSIVLYNPSSRKRKDHLRRACEIMLEYKSPGTVCGIVRNIGREGQSCRVLSLEELKDTPVDMFSTVFVGNAETVSLDGRMVTPRGYNRE